MMPIERQNNEPDQSFPLQSVDLSCVPAHLPMSCHLALVAMPKGERDELFTMG